MLFQQIFKKGYSENPFRSQTQRIKLKLKKAARVDSSRAVFGASSHKYALHNTATAQDIGKWEAAHGVKLPEDYAFFLTRLGNGGAGPYYGIYSLDKATSYSEREALASPCVLHPKMAKDEWNRLAEPLISDRDVSGEEYDAARSRIFGGMLCFGTQGCEYDMYLVLQGPHCGRVVYTSDVYPDVPFFFVYEKSFLDWYERWLDEIIAGYELSWFGANMPGDEKALIATYREATGNEEKLEALDSMLKFRTLSMDTIVFLKEIADKREADHNAAVQLLCKASIADADSYLMELLQTGNKEEFLQALKFLNWYGKSAGADKYIEVIREEFARFEDVGIMRHVGYIFDHYDAINIQDFVPYLCHTDPKVQMDAFYATRSCKDKAAHWETIAQMLERK